MANPVARVNDLHTCPLHAGGPVLPPGAPNVLVNGLPAGRVTDPAVCTGAVDAISTGAATVLVNGLPLAHTTSTSLHGGVVVLGSVNVVVGGPDVAFRFSLSGSPAAIAQAQQGLGLLYSIPSGRQLIARLAASGQTVTIAITTGGSDATPASSAAGPKATAVRWNPAQRVEGLPASDPRGGAVVLGHELCHSLHNAEDTQGKGPHEHHPGQQGSSDRGEERQTVGSAPPHDSQGRAVNDSNGNPAGTHTRRPDGTLEPGIDYSHQSPTENTLRNDFGYQQRATYYPSTWPGGPPW